jgi:hypothetical protein
MKLLFAALLVAVAIAGCHDHETHPVPYCERASPAYQVFNAGAYSTDDSKHGKGDHDHMTYMSGAELANALVAKDWSNPSLSGKYASTVAVECHRSAKWTP